MAASQPPSPRGAPSRVEEASPRLRWELCLVSHHGVRSPEFRRLVGSQMAGSTTGAPPEARLSVPKGDRTCREQQSVFTASIKTRNHAIYEFAWNGFFPPGKCWQG